MGIVGQVALRQLTFVNDFMSSYPSSVLKGCFVELEHDMHGVNIVRLQIT